MSDPSPPPPDRRRRRALLTLGSALATLLLAEGALRLLVEPSPVSSGRLLGRELPPFRIVPAGYRPDPEAHREPRTLAGGVQVTRGDLEGIPRPDPRLGFAPRESAASVNGWWQTNGLGARRRGEVALARPADRARVLLLGDSYAQGHGLRQEETLAALLDSRPGLEVVNLGVSGYSVGQALLRYQGLAALEAHRALLLLVPSADLWREVNVLRSLRGWEAYVALPRFALEGGAPRLVEPPYAGLDELLVANRDGLDPRLRDHLRAHDRLYEPARYEPWPTSRVSVLSRLAQAAWLPGPPDERAFLAPESEAAQVTLALLSALRAAAEARGQRFVVAVLPVVTDVAAYGEDPAFRLLWDALVEALRTRATTLDLMPALQGGALDLAYDASHYGPKVQRRLAQALEPALR